MKRELSTLALGLLGYFSQQAWLGSADGIASKSPLQVDRERAIAIARDVAVRQGVDTREWRFGVALEERERTEAVRENLRSELLAPFPPVSIEVGGYHPPSLSSLRVTLTPDGKLLGWRLHEGRVRPKPDDQDQPAAAEAEFRAIVGAASARYQKTNEGARSQDGFRTTWEAPEPGRPGLLARFQVLIRGGKVVQAEHRLEIGDAALSEYQRRSQQLLLSSLPWATAWSWLVIALTLWMFFSAFLRRYDHLRMGIAAGLLGAPFLILYHLAGGGIDGVAMSLSESPGDVASSRFLIQLAEIVPLLLTGFLLAAGYAFLPAAERPRWAAIKLLSEGKAWSRPVGKEVAAGLLFGAAMSALFLLPARMGWASPASPGAAVVLLLERAPLLQTLNPTAHWSALIPLAIVIPWFGGLRRSLRWLLWPALAGGILVYLSLGTVSRFDWKASLLISLLMYGLVLACYRIWGLLAAMMAPSAAVTLYMSGLLQSMPPERLQSAGWTSLLVWLAVLFVGAVIGWRGEDIPEQELLASMEPPSSSVSRSERMRLKADFEVARRAQQDMLPSQPPEIAGYTLAGSCRPALEVGGDLFEYLAFPSGEVGLCVADVSGKGVQASLYMTMTKGMLTAALEEPADLPQILSRLNRHLKDWCRKRSFVTMSLALLDPATGVLRHARAGHNPPVLLHAGKARFLQPRGLGLGLASPSIFDRALELEEIQLEPGDCLILYSDGLTECMNARQQQYGEERLLRIAEASAGLPASEVEEAILREVREFQGSAESHDDLTILVLRREPRPVAALA